MHNIRVVWPVVLGQGAGMTGTPKQFDLTSGLMLLALATVWGGSFFFAEIALDDLPPLTLTFHRVLWALPVLGAWLWWRGIALPKGWRTWGGCLVMGLLNNALPFSLIFWGQSQMDSGLAAILNGMTAIFGAVVAGLLLRDEPLTQNKIMGAIVGLLGVLVIMGPGLLTGFDPFNLAQLAILGAAVSYAFASVWGRVAMAGGSPEANAFGMLVCSAGLMLPVMLWVEGPPQFEMSGQTVAALVGLAALSTASAYVLYFNILRRAGAANLMLVTLLVPAVAVALGALVLGERLETRAFAGFAFIALGLIITDGRALRWLWGRRARA